MNECDEASGHRYVSFAEIAPLGWIEAEQYAPYSNERALDQRHAAILYAAGLNPECAVRNIHEATTYVRRKCGDATEYFIATAAWLLLARLRKPGVVA